jgi:hypothetical protein
MQVQAKRPYQAISKVGSCLCPAHIPTKLCTYVYISALYPHRQATRQLLGPLYTDVSEVIGMSITGSSLTKRSSTPVMETSGLRPASTRNRPPHSIAATPTAYLITVGRSDWEVWGSRILLQSLTAMLALTVCHTQSRATKSQTGAHRISLHLSICA